MLLCLGTGVTSLLNPGTSHLLCNPVLLQHKPCRPYHLVTNLCHHLYLVIGEPFLSFYLCSFLFRHLAPSTPLQYAPFCGNCSILCLSFPGTVFLLPGVMFQYPHYGFAIYCPLLLRWISIRGILMWGCSPPRPNKLKYKD